MKKNAKQSAPNQPKFACWTHKAGNLSAIVFYDKKDVNFLTNKYTVETALVQQRQNRQDNKTARIIPKVAQDYSQEGMGHVDVFDAALARFMDHRNRSWCRTHFLSMLKMAIVNSWVMYCALLEKRGKGKKTKQLSVSDFMELLKKECSAEWLAEREEKNKEKKQ